MDDVSERNYGAHMRGILRRDFVFVRLTPPSILRSVGAAHAIATTKRHREVRQARGE